MTLASLGGSMAPVALAAPLIEQGQLVELPPRKRITGTLYWQRTRLAARLLDQLTQAVRAVAAKELQSTAERGQSSTG